MGKTFKEKSLSKKEKRKRNRRLSPDSSGVKPLNVPEPENIIRDSEYQPVVFRARLHFIPGSGVTELYLNENKVISLPLLVSDLTVCHYSVKKRCHNFNLNYETQILAEYVQKVKSMGKPCCLMVPGAENGTCSSIVDCSYRHWLEEGRPQCTLR